MVEFIVKNRKASTDGKVESPKPRPEHSFTAVTPPKEQLRSYEARLKAGLAPRMQGHGQWGISRGHYSGFGR